MREGDPSWILEGEMMGALEATTHYRTCPLCEATCGLEIDVDGEQIVSIRGDDRDVFSKGFICPKSYSLKELHSDPDRLRSPLRRRPDGTFEEIGWDDAFAAIDRALTPIVAEHGRAAVSVFMSGARSSPTRGCRTASLETRSISLCS